jgi:hypothetical protein
MYPHTATLWAKGPEVEGRATWTRLDVDRCRFEKTSGFYRALAGDTTADSELVIIDHDATLCPKAGDRIALGSVAGDTPPKGAWAIGTVEALSVGTRAIHHWEVYAR